MAKKSMLVLVAQYSSAGLALPVGAFVGYLLGGYLDKVFGTHFLYLVLLIAGVAGGLIQLLRLANSDTSD
jgi:F0F1-type ATP synthase assembly protein I